MHQFEGVSRATLYLPNLRRRGTNNVKIRDKLAILSTKILFLISPSVNKYTPTDEKKAVKGSPNLPFSGNITLDKFMSLMASTLQNNNGAFPDNP